MALNMTLFAGGLSLGLFTWLLTYSSVYVWNFFRGLFTYNHRAY
jgi:hypothetical protein